MSSIAHVKRTWGIHPYCFRIDACATRRGEIRSVTDMNRREFTALPLALAALGSHERIDETLRGGIASRKIPAVAAMVAGPGGTLYEGAFGVRDSSGTAVKADSIFGIASMTKAITTTAALQLVEQDKVQLDEPVAKHLPQFEGIQVLERFDPA